MSESQSTVSTQDVSLEQSGSERLETRAGKASPSAAASAAAGAPTGAATSTAELLRTLERDGFSVMGLSGKPVALETMYLRISRKKVGLGKRAWQSLGSPAAVIGLRRGAERALALVAAGVGEPNALMVEWDAKLELAVIRQAAWIGAVLGAGSTVAVFDAVFERSHLMVSGVRAQASGAQRNAVIASAKAGARVARAGSGQTTSGRVKSGS